MVFHGTIPEYHIEVDITPDENEKQRQIRVCFCFLLTLLFIGAAVTTILWKLIQPLKA